MAKAILKGITIFQSTLPVWGATAKTERFMIYFCDKYTNIIVISS